MKTETLEKPLLSLQERVLAYGMRERLGSVATQYSGDGRSRMHTNFLETDELSDSLIDRFKNDPKDSIAYLRQNMLAIGADKRLTKPQREDRLGRYLDAYTSLTLKLDHAGFPGDDIVKTGVPSYIPDNFIDMGGLPNKNPLSRGGRDQMMVDKEALYDKHRDFLMRAFSHDWSNVDSTTQKKAITRELLAHVYRSMPYDYSLIENERNNTGDITKLHEMDKGICRHIALSFQILAQACGLTTRYVKCHVDGGRHAANAVRINHDWYLADPTIPDYERGSDGKNHWKPGVYRIGHEPKAGDSFDVSGKFSGKKHTYSIHDDMFWRISE